MKRRIYLHACPNFWLELSPGTCAIGVCFLCDLSAGADMSDPPYGAAV